MTQQRFPARYARNANKIVAHINELYLAVAMIFFAYTVVSSASVPARLGKGHDAKEIGHNLARERSKSEHNLVCKRHKIFYA